MSEETIQLRPVDASNFEACVALSVEERQVGFVASNLRSLAEAKVHPECVPLAIYSGEIMVGFLMHGVDPADARHWLVRLMIDQSHQRRGHGAAALRRLIEELRADRAAGPLYSCFVKGNEVVERLYASFGFTRTGEFDSDGEVVMRLAL